MMNVFTMESANLVCGDTGSDNAPGKSTHLVLSELKLPGFEENYVDFIPGGAPVAIEIDTHFNRLESNFNLQGWQPEVMGIMAQSDIQLQSFTAYGLIRDRRTGEALQSVAYMRGRLGRVNPTAFRKGDLQMFEYSIRSIVHYELSMSVAVNTQPVSIYYWDFFDSTFIVRGPNGVETNVNDDLIRILAIPGTTG